ncbi:MAG TPA: hypothetical protein VL727_11890 [Puia sp.]|jgi:hypothetical protein|nr:hypothetical protein [Puia sp.]
MNTYKFIKEGREWYIDLPEYLAGGELGRIVRDKFQGVVTRNMTTSLYRTL